TTYTIKLTTHTRLTTPMRSPRWSSSRMPLMAIMLTVLQLCSAQTSRPSVIKFGMYHNMIDSLLMFDGTQMYAGAKAAEKEINAANMLDGLKLEIEHYPAAGFFSDAATVAATAAAFTFDPSYFGAILSDWVSSVTLTYIIGTYQLGNYPMVAARQLFDSTSRFEISLRQPPSTEYYMMLHHAFNAETARCTSFGIITRGSLGFPLIFVTLAELGCSAMQFDFDSNFFIPPNVPETLDKWFAGDNTTGYNPPQCGLFFTTPDDAKAILEGMYADPRFNMSRMTFYSAGIAAEGNWNSTLYGTAPFEQLHFVTNFPDTDSATDPLATSFRASLNDYLTNVNMSEVPAAMKQLPFATIPTLPALEGYMAVKWVAEILSMMDSIDRTLFLENIYRRRFFWVEDTKLGPMTDRCLQNAFSDLTCQCNVGMSMLRIVRVNTSNGYPMLDTTDTSISVMTFPMDQCYLVPSNLRTPISFAVWYPQSSSAAEITTVTNFKTMMSVLGTAYNKALTTARVMFSSTLMNPLMPFNGGESSAEYFSRLTFQRRPSIMFSDLFSEVTIGIMNMIVPTVTVYEDAPLTPATQYSRYSWMLKPSLADLAQGIALQLQEMYSIGSRMGRTPQVVGVSDTANGMRVATLSINTVQWPISGGVQNLTDMTVMRAALRGAMESAAAGHETVFFVSTVSAAVTLNAINAAVEASQSYEGTSGATNVWAHFVLAIATDQDNLYRAKFALSNTSALPFFPIYFGSSMYAFWEPTQAQRLQVISLLGNTTDISVVEDVQLYTGLMLFELLTTTLQSMTVVRPTPSDLMDALYRTSTLSATGIVVGPIFDANCSDVIITANEVDRRCQCYKILRTLNVHDYRDWLMNTASHNPKFQWSMSTCGVKYSPLIVASSANVALIAGIAAPLGTVALGFMFYFMCCFGRRNNRTAPKDSEEAFAMVFTDIQSSTSLWARAPEAMGEPLEQHHALLRKLVSRHDGYEVKTIGDSFMVAFKHARDAAEFALSIQTTLFAADWNDEIDDVYISLAQEAHEDALANEDPKKGGEKRIGVPQWEDEVNYPLNWNGIRVRVGMHWGVGSVKFDPVSQGYDYYGTLVNTAARVEGVGNGGQVLATKDMYAQLEAEDFNFNVVDVKPMGPQPLRGLDQPVPLYQLCPNALRGREFAALRLDVENDVEESSEGTGTGRLDDGTQNSGAEETPDLMMARLLRRQKDGGPMLDYLQRVVMFMETLLRTSPLSWRKETVKALLKKWHVPSRKPRERESAELTLTYDVTALVARAGMASEEARHAARKNGDTASRHSVMSRRLSTRKRSVVSVGVLSTTTADDVETPIPI
ncbi:receptor-type adenylate cyclase, putative, partial [Bodo saltans]